MKILRAFVFGILIIGSINTVFGQNNILVFQSDFGLKDGAVSAMKGVASGVSAELKLYDVTHEIPAYNIWESSIPARANRALLASRNGVRFRC